MLLGNNKPFHQISQKMKLHPKPMVNLVCKEEKDYMLSFVNNQTSFRKSITTLPPPSRSKKIIE